MADTLARARARATFMARPGLNQILMIHSDAIGSIAAVAVAAIEFASNGIYSHDDQFPSDNDGCCVGCGSWTEGGIRHADDCHMMALESAIRQLAGEVTDGD